MGWTLSSLAGIAAAIAAFSPASAGEQAGEITITADRRVATYGQTVLLAGTVAESGAGVRVAVTARPYGGERTTTTVSTEADGTWRLRARPQIGTTYRASAGGSASAPLAVAVRPRVHLVVISGRVGVFYTRVEAARSYASRVVAFERLDGRWATVTLVRLGREGARRFRATLPRGLSRVRVSVPAAPGYVRGSSEVRPARR